MRGRKLGKLVALIVVYLIIVVPLLPSGAGAESARFRPVTPSGRGAAGKVVPAPNLPTDYLPGEIIVKFKPGTPREQQESAKAKSSIAFTKKRLVPRKPGSSEIHLVGLRPGDSVEDAVKRLKSKNVVEVAEPNFKRKPFYVPNDPSFGLQWGLHNTGQSINGVTGTADADIDGPEAWDIEKGDSSPVAVAVIDTGVDLSHPDLSSKLWLNTDESLGNGIDDDGNGYIDDVNGYNFGSGLYQVRDESYVFFGSDAPDPYISDVAQSISGNNEIISAIGIEVWKFGNPASGIRVSLRASLSGADLAYFDIAPSEISGISYIEKALSARVRLLSGTTYYIVAHTDVRNFDNSYAIFLTTKDNNGNIDAFPSGTLHYKGTGSWAADPDSDLFFIASGTGPSPADDSGHGTHVSGIIGAATDNSTGVAGVSPGARIMALKAGNDEFFTDFSIMEAIYYATDNGARVINMSLGGYFYSATLDSATTYAYNNGVVVVAAAGNDGNTTINYPAGNSFVVGVGATNNKDQKASFSNRNSTVDVSAPGVSVFSSMPTYHVALNDWGYSQNYDYLSGTSMATPHVAGLAALALAMRPDLTPSQVEQLMETGADDLGSPGRDNSYGYGRINAYNVVSALLTEVNLPLGAGWNLVSLPLRPIGPLTAQDVLDSINASAGSTIATQISRWDNAAGTWQSRIDGLPPGVQNFDLALGEGYFIKLAAAGTWRVVGVQPSSVVALTMGAGWNLVSVPYSTTAYRAQDLIDAINAQGGSVSQVSKWNNSSGMWESRIDGLPLEIYNFDIIPGEGYFIRSASSSSFTP